MFIRFESILLYAPEEQYSIALIGNVSSYNKFEINVIQFRNFIDPTWFVTMFLSSDSGNTQFQTV